MTNRVETTAEPSSSGRRDSASTCGQFDLRARRSLAPPSLGPGRLALRRALRPRPFGPADGGRRRGRRIARRKRFLDRLVKPCICGRAPFARRPLRLVFHCCRSAALRNGAASRAAAFLREGLIDIRPRAGGCETSELVRPDDRLGRQSPASIGVRFCARERFQGFRREAR
jgi:hypothetical protein